jgi:hypothetical protein
MWVRWGCILLSCLALEVGWEKKFIVWCLAPRFVMPEFLTEQPNKSFLLLILRSLRTILQRNGQMITIINIVAWRHCPIMYYSLADLTITKHANYLVTSIFVGFLLFPLIFSLFIYPPLFL